MRSLSGFERSDVAQHFGLTNALDVSQLAGKELQRAWEEDPKRYRERALCAVRETRAVADLLSPSYFIQAQIFPYNYQDVIVRGNATRINALFLREYLGNATAFPRCRWRAALKAVTPTSFSPAWRATSGIATSPRSIPRSCCSSIAFPVNDQLQIFRHLLTDLRTFRLQAKSDMREAKDAPQRRYFHALQNTFKILINSFYGYLGFAQGNFADFEAAARVTQIGRDLLKQMIEWLKAQGAQVIEVDTDGIYFVPPLMCSRGR